MLNNYVETSIQECFMSGIPGAVEHTAHFVHLICKAKQNQRPLAVMLLDLRNAFGAVHHNLIPIGLVHHHI